jgi:hypothetical protein
MPTISLTVSQEVVDRIYAAFDAGGPGGILEDDHTPADAAAIKALLIEKLTQYVHATERRIAREAIVDTDVEIT